MRHQSNGMRTVEIIHRHKTISFSRLKELTVPEIYKNAYGVLELIHRLEQEGEASVTYEPRAQKYRKVVSISLTQIGKQRWIDDVRDDLKSQIRHTAPPRRYAYAEERNNLEKKAPCNRVVTHCYHTGCYWQSVCSAHPEYINLEKA